MEDIRNEQLIEEIKESLKTLKVLKIEENSPGFKEACANLGIQPEELRIKSKKEFDETSKDEYVILARYDHHLKRMVTTLRAIIKEKKRIEKNAHLQTSKNMKSLVLNDELPEIQSSLHSEIQQPGAFINRTASENLSPKSPSSDSSSSRERTIEPEQGLTSASPHDQRYELEHFIKAKLLEKMKQKDYNTKIEKKLQKHNELLKLHEERRQQQLEKNRKIMQDKIQQIQSRKILLLYINVTMI